MNQALSQAFMIDCCSMEFIAEDIYPCLPHVDHLRRGLVLHMAWAAPYVGRYFFFSRMRGGSSLHHVRPVYSNFLSTMKIRRLHVC